MISHVRAVIRPPIACHLATLLVVCLSLALPATGSAALTTFGSQLSVPATKDTAHDLAYTGADVPLPGSIFHVPHDGADTALWNASLTTDKNGR